MKFDDIGVANVRILVSRKVPGAEQYESHGAEMSLSLDGMVTEDRLTEAWRVCQETVIRQLNVPMIGDEDMAELKPVKGKSVADTWPSVYLEKATLRGKPVTLTVTGVFETEIWNKHQQSKVQRLALKFTQTPLILLLSRSDAFGVAAVLGDSYDDWTGKNLVIKADSDPKNKSNLIWKFSPAATQQSGDKKPPQAQQTQPQPVQEKKVASRPLAPGKLRELLLRKASERAGGDKACSTQVAQAVAVCMTRGLNTEITETKEQATAANKLAGERYHIVLLSLWGVDSAKDLTMSQGLATLDWLTGGVVKTNAELNAFAKQELVMYYDWVYYNEPDYDAAPEDDGDDIHGDEAEASGLQGGPDTEEQCEGWSSEDQSAPAGNEVPWEE